MTRCHPCHSSSSHIRELVELGLVKNSNEADVGDEVKDIAVGGNDASALLAMVLEGMEGAVVEAGGLWNEADVGVVKLDQLHRSVVDGQKKSGEVAEGRK